jgi:Cu/Ag efflux pump CusA
MGGLSSSTILTLLFVPSVYIIFEDIYIWLTKKPKSTSTL